jgi:hypothetical protein
MLSLLRDSSSTPSCVYTLSFDGDKRPLSAGIFSFSGDELPLSAYISSFRYDIIEFFSSYESPFACYFIFNFEHLR